jgi:hypothetical protein
MYEMFCYYCGSTDDLTLDHTVPVSFYSPRPTRKGMKSKYTDPVPVVDCCTECNSTLHNKLVIDVRDRAELIQKRYVKKYRKVLNLPRWDEEDIDELGKNLRSVIVRDQILQTNLKERLDYLEMIINLTEDPFLAEKQALGYARNSPPY